MLGPLVGADLFDKTGWPCLFLLRMFGRSKTAIQPRERGTSRIPISGPPRRKTNPCIDLSVGDTALIELLFDPIQSLAVTPDSQVFQQSLNIASKEIVKPLSPVDPDFDASVKIDEVRR